jgi:hypothetical protein
MEYVDWAATGFVLIPQRSHIVRAPRAQDQVASNATENLTTSWVRRKVCETATHNTGRIIRGLMIVEQIALIGVRPEV